MKLVIIFQFFSIISVNGVLYHYSLCHNISTISNNETPALMFIEQSNNENMKKSLEDASCWLQKNFKVKKIIHVDTNVTKEALCFKISMTPDISPGEIILVITSGPTFETCFKQIYGPLPNILSAQMYVDMKNVAKNTFTRRLGLKFDNTGGFLGVQYDLFGSKNDVKIRKALEYMVSLNNRSVDYADLIPWWMPSILIPPDSFFDLAIAHHQTTLEQSNSTPFILIVSCLPMILFSIAVSAYLVIHPRGGLTYTDEEVDFVIEEVVSNSKVNIVNEESTHKTILIDQAIDPVINNDVTPPDAQLITAIPNEMETSRKKDGDIKTDPTFRSDKTIRQDPPLIGSNEKTSDSN